MAQGLSGFDGYIAALQERQFRELDMLGKLPVRHIVVEPGKTGWESAYSSIDEFLGGKLRMSIDIQMLSADNFGLDSLDGFVRHQLVEKVWKHTESGLQLESQPFTEDWDQQKCREIVARMLSGLRRGYYGVGAFDCVPAAEFFAEAAADEPFDIQLEYILR